MPCYSPLVGYMARKPNPETGKFPIVFTPREGYEDLKVTLPCGKCLGCKLERSRVWAVRCLHEASLYQKNCFITLTYNDMFVPSDGSLNKRHVQLFFKRLRKWISTHDSDFKPIPKKWQRLPVFNDKLRSPRYFQCGEYGSLFSRPHYHACLFNWDFPDKYLWSIRNGIKLYRSDLLESLWSCPITKNSLGFCTIGDVNFESAAYVARYVLKKITGPDADDHYCGQVPEYVAMSRRPGIGLGWFDKFKNDVYSVDRVIVNDRLKIKPPRYYDTKYDLTNPDEYGMVKKTRIKEALSIDDDSPRRLRVKFKLKKLQVQRLKRSIEI